MERPQLTITPYRNGPYLIRGPFRLVDQDGSEILIDRRTVALCRCGHSKIRPFCDGTHKTIGFTAPSGSEDRVAGDVNTSPGGRRPGHLEQN